mmetsp:Transcript_37113/g.41474  ORF Transcript_37113/g.41474 Transcript_37113/m.41474 type:complete len:257 (-) Transcript_37113:263-1033(-)
MRNNQQTTSLSSSSQSHHPKELFSSVIDFNRNRSNESTETANNDTIKMTTTTTNTKPITIAPQSLTFDLPRSPHTRSFSSGSACGSYQSGGGGCGSSIYSAEGRGVPISPKKMPMTPPRDAGSPAGSYGSHGYQYTAAGCLPPSQQHSFLALPRSSAPPSFPFRRSQPQAQQAQQQQQQEYPVVSSSPYTGCDLSSLFRSAPVSDSEHSSSLPGCYALHRCNAFDEGDDMYDEDDDEEGFCYSDDEEDSVCGMAEF